MQVVKKMVSFFFFKTKSKLFSGHIASIRPTSSSLAPMNFTFDQSGRLAGAHFDPLNEFYVYDKSGRLNETKKVGDIRGRGEKFSYVGENRLVSVSDKFYALVLFLCMTKIFSA